MYLNKKISGLALACAVAVLPGCATKPTYDYSEFKKSRPASILVLPPVNDSSDVGASYSFLSQSTYPLAESGYYVYPVTLVNETFHQNGISTPNDMHEVSLKKLREIFGADTALYIKVKDYGTSYKLISSESRVTAEAKLVDLRSEQVLWEGKATASSAEGRSANGGLVGVLVGAVVNQILESSGNRSHQIASITANRLLSAGMPNGLLFGPRSPKYQKDGQP